MSFGPRTEGELLWGGTTVVFWAKEGFFIQGLRLRVDIDVSLNPNPSTLNPKP